MDLVQKKCMPCEKGTLPVTKAEAERVLAGMSHWELSEDAKKITKTYKFKDWQEAVSFVNAISAVAEDENHHPDIDLHWGRVGVTLSTHSIGGLSENDFIVAAKIDTLQV